MSSQDYHQNGGQTPDTTQNDIQDPQPMTNQMDTDTPLSLNPAENPKTGPTNDQQPPMDQPDNATAPMEQPTTPQLPIKKAMILRYNTPPEGTNGQPSHKEELISPTVESVVYVTRNPQAQPRSTSAMDHSGSQQASSSPMTAPAEPSTSGTRTSKFLHQTYAQPFEDIQVAGGAGSTDVTQRMSDVDYDVESGRPNPTEIGKSNNLLYSTSLCNFPDFADLKLLFEQHFQYQEISKSETNKIYFEYLLNLIPTLLEHLNPEMQQDFYDEINYTFMRCPDAFSNGLAIDYKNVHPLFQPQFSQEFCKGKFYCFPITFESLEKVLPKENEMISNIHQFNVKEIQNSMINWHYLVDTMKPLKTSLEEAVDKETDDTKKNELNDQIKFIDAKTKHLEELIKTNEKKLLETEDQKSKYKNVYEVPKVTGDTKSTFNSEDAVFRISYFSNDGTVQFSDFFSKFTLFAKSQKLSEDGMIDLLGTLLKDEPFRVFMDYYSEDSSLATILAGLGARYNDKKTLTQYLTMLRNLKRQSGESLRAVMSRASCLISMTKQFTPEGERKARQRLMQNDYLLKLASEKARHAMEKYIRKAQRVGLTVEYECLLEIACDVEENEEYPLQSSTFLAAPAERTSARLAELRKNRAPSPLGVRNEWRKRSGSADSLSSVSPSPRPASPKFTYDDRHMRNGNTNSDRGRQRDRSQSSIRPPTFQKGQPQQQTQNFKQQPQQEVPIYQQPFANPNNSKIRGPPPPPPGGQSTRPQRPPFNQGNNFQQNRPAFTQNYSFPPRSTGAQRPNGFGQHNAQNFNTMGIQRQRPSNLQIPHNINNFHNNGPQTPFNRNNFGNNSPQQQFRNNNQQFRNGNQRFNYANQYQQNKYGAADQKQKQRTHVLQTLQLSPTANQFYQKIGLNIPILCNICNKMHFAFDACNQKNVKPNYTQGGRSNGNNFQHGGRFNGNSYQKGGRSNSYSNLNFKRSSSKENQQGHGKGYQKQ